MPSPATAYDGSTGDVPARTRPGILRAPFTVRTWTDTIHLVLNLPIGIVGFTYVAVFIALGVGLTPLCLLGLPLLALTLMGSRAFGRVERARASALLDEHVRAPAPLRHRPGPTGWIRSGLTDRIGWRASLYLFLQLPWGVFTFAATTALWATSLSAITYPLTQPLYRRADMPGAMLSGDGPHESGADHYLAGPGPVSLTVALGVVLFFATPWLVRGMANVDRVMVRGLLGPALLSEQVRDLTVSRGAAVDTAASDLRRIERDLHDGAQARLVALAMDLGMAKENLSASRDTETARMVSSAHDEVKLALQELRDLARGIHPAVLTDRGLDAALSSIAARCTVPVRVEVDLPDRPPAPIESVAYFCASELLTNVSKHARASHAWVTVGRQDGRMYLIVADDGAGGASTGKGSGLAGLIERVRGVDGTLTVDSPEGGPTRVTVWLPL
ncbi:sensor histidine kinase [Embleya sp. NPDC050493]|uniref:sensor histidine kinase n=1 Tax=Embleya sp. NPDC050493 TaxID=3363989 RepID=UPI0037B4E42A